MNWNYFHWLIDFIRKYPLLFIFALVAVFFVLYLLVPIDYSREVLAPMGEGDRVFFGEGTVVAQQFMPHVGLSKIAIPLGTSAGLKGPLLLHLREKLAGPDVATAVVFSYDGQVATFVLPTFWRVPNYLFWVLEAPHATPNSFWTFREQDSSVFKEGRPYRNGHVLKGNMSFTEIWRLPRLFLWRHTTGDVGLKGWEKQSLVAGVVAILLYLFLPWRKWKLSEQMLVWGLIIVGFCFHMWLALRLPLINDEGAYVQDVLQSTTHLLPFRDFLTKGPAYLLVLWAWSFIIPNAIIAWRLFSALAWVAATYLVWLLAKEWQFKQPARVLTVLGFTLIPAAVALTTPLLLQTASVPLALLGLLFATRAATQNKRWLAALAALAMTLGFFIRVTTVVPAFLAALLLVMLSSVKGRARFKLLGIYVGVGLLLFGLVFGVAAATIGVKKAAVMVNAEALIISQNRQEQSQAKQQAPEPLIRTLTIESRLFWRAGLPLILALFMLPMVFVDRRRFWLSTSLLIVEFIVCWYVLLHLQDTDYLLPKKFITTQWLMVTTFVGLPLITAAAQLLYGERQGWRDRLPQLKIAIILVLWLVFMTYAYAKWGRFRQSYLTEFLPQLALLFGLSVHFVWRLCAAIQPVFLRYVGQAVLVGILVITTYQGYVMAAQYPHTGTISQGSLSSIVALIQTHVPSGTMIFTAQPVATAFSERPILFGYSHPGWYREARLGTIPKELLTLLFREPAVITKYLDTEAEFVLNETRTDEIYFDGYPERRAILKKKFESVGTVYNDMAGDTFELFQRVDQ